MSKQFLVRILTRGFVDILDERCESDNYQTLGLLDLLSPRVCFCYCLLPVPYLWDDKQRLLFYQGSYTPERVFITVSISTYEEDHRKDFAVCLRLILNVSKDEIEKVELHDRVIVNELVFNAKEGKTIFEKR